MMSFELIELLLHLYKYIDAWQGGPGDGFVPTLIGKIRECGYIKLNAFNNNV